MATIRGTQANDDLIGTPDDDLISGFQGDDTLAGGAGNDTLNGGFGNDSMSGGPGDDTYRFQRAGDQVIEAADEGTDAVLSTLAFSLPDHVEELFLVGYRGISGTGNALDNLIVGNSANNRLDGGAGADTMKGGGGNDGYEVDDAADRVIELADAGYDQIFASASYRLPHNVEALWLMGNAPLDGLGSISNDTLRGNNAANRLGGGPGADDLFGFGGSDTLLGMAGNDSLTGGDATDTLSGGLGNDTLRGDGGADFLSGGPGDDLLIGDPTDADTLAGGSGNDTYTLFSTPLHVLRESVNGGIDEVRTGFSYKLQANFENLTLSPGAQHIRAIGNSLDNVITGNTRSDILDGRGGADVLRGGGGNDRLIYDPADTLVDGGAGVDTLGVQGAGVLVDLTAIANDVIVRMERVNLTGSGNNTLSLTAQDLLDLSDTSDALTVIGNAGDVVNAFGAWQDGGIAGDYHLYTLGAAELSVGVDVAVSIL